MIAAVVFLVTSNVDGAGVGNWVDILVVPLVVIMVRHSPNAVVPRLMPVERLMTVMANEGGMQKDEAPSDCLNKTALNSMPLFHRCNKDCSIAFQRLYECTTSQ